MRRYEPGPHDRITRDESPDYPAWSLDEVVLRGVDVHLERTDVDCYSLVISAGPHSESLLLQMGIRPRPGSRRAIDVYVYHEAGEDLGAIPSTDYEVRQ